ncbi:hypothetical protein [Butyrivibrio sp. AE2032]|uniref:hypothetical protein n=1 Tax=Butyrivibrio sp. AE2032 TaxID=1458463 RepID=UPI00055844C3|nr:hypothetical protein [Butyrivibrio sp. AE2032]
MRNAKEIYQELDIQIGREQTVIEFFVAPTNRSLPGSDETVETCRNRIAELTKICKIFQNYKQLDENGLFGEFTLDMLKEAERFCSSEKERYYKIVTDSIHGSNNYINIIPNTDMVIVYMEADIYLMRLIALWS